MLAKLTLLFLTLQVKYTQVIFGIKKIDAEVLILGAGVAGVGAAKTLVENSVANFIILEAENRIGGRVKSTMLKSTNKRVELGANWIHGINPQNPSRHPIWKILQYCGGLDGRVELKDDTAYVFDDNGENISEKKEFRERLSQWHKIRSLLGNYSRLRQEESLPDITVRKALENLGWIPRSSVDNLIEWNGFDSDYAARPDRISLHNTFPETTYIDFGSLNYFVNDQEGFEKVVKCLSQDVLTKKDKRLVLNSAVIEIDWSNPSIVCVKTRERSLLKEYCAPHVVITFSLGVLQSEFVKFIPALPSWKRYAINSCIFVTYLKIFLEFDRIFWKSDIDVDTILYASGIFGYYTYFEPVFKDSPILFTVVTDDVARMVYRQPIYETSRQIMAVLRLIFGKDIPDPLDVTIPDWLINPYFRGTYTSAGIGCSNHLISESVSRLHFAGEAAAKKYSGYVHGAYLSGIQTAKDIIDIIG